MRKTSFNAADINRKIAFEQPKLRASQNGHDLVIEGDFIVTDDQDIGHKSGALTSYQIRIEFDDKFPKNEPRVFEVGSRIPWKADRHVNTDGSCCITVWENWLAQSDNQSIFSYIKGPLHEYFLGQFVVESGGDWPFGEFSHGREGLIEAFAEVLGVTANKTKVEYYLRLLAKPWPKGHWLCPCGSGAKLSDCHKSDLFDLHRKIAPSLAKKMLRRLKT